MLKPVSGSCNMRCRYCFYADEMEKRATPSFGQMTGETAEVLIDKALAYADGARVTFGFQGGEPTLRGLPFFRTFTDLVEQRRKGGKGISYALQTNGLLLDDEWAAFFKEKGFLIGLSMDGTADLHNRNRLDAQGKGTHARVLKAAALLQRHGVPFNLLTVVNSMTARSIASIYRFYRKNGLLYQQYIPCLDPLGEEPGGRNYSLTEEQFGAFLCHLFDLWYQDRKAGNFVYIHYFECLAGMLLGQGPGACGMSGICGVQNIVEADGSVYPCDFYMLDEYRLGSILEEDFASLMEKHRPFLVSSYEGLEECAACEYGPICHGGCRRDRQFPDGIRKNRFCKAYKTFFAHALPGLMELTRGH